MMISAPAKTPCGSCPYRRDVPSGIWSREEYAKLPAYDAATGDQPAQLFLCHQQNSRVCAGWCGTHDMAESLAVRFAGIMGSATVGTIKEILRYSTGVPLFSSGKEARAHGLVDIKKPQRKATIAIIDLIAKRARTSAGAATAQPRSKKAGRSHARPVRTPKDRSLSMPEQKQNSSGVTPGQWEIDPHKDTDLYVWISRRSGNGQREPLAGTGGRIERKLAVEVLRNLNTAPELNLRPPAPIMLCSTCPERFIREAAAREIESIETGPMTWIGPKP